MQTAEALWLRENQTWTQHQCQPLVEAPGCTTPSPFLTDRQCLSSAITAEFALLILSTSSEDILRKHCVCEDVQSAFSSVQLSWNGVTKGTQVLQLPIPNRSPFLDSHTYLPVYFSPNVSRLTDITVNRC